MKFRLFFWPWLLVLASCAVMNKAEMAAVRDRHVAAGTVAKLEHGDTLVPQDVIELTRRGVPEAQIVKYIRRTGVTFLLTRDDSVKMKSAGVSAQVIDLMAKESAKFSADYAVTHQDPYGGTYAPPPGPLLLDDGSGPLIY